MSKNVGFSIKESLNLDSSSSACSDSDNRIVLSLAETPKQYNRARVSDHTLDSYLANNA
jgi:hypothetical protein